MTGPAHPAKHVWILDEGSQGHLVQSRGLIRELAKIIPLDVSELSVRPAFATGMGRSIAKRLLPRLRSSSLFRLFYPQCRCPREAPDLIVSSGPQSLPALQFLAGRHQAPSVFVQGTLAVPEGSVTAVMRPFEGTHRPDYIFLPALFTDITPAAVGEAAAAYRRDRPLPKDTPANALFIGASSSKIPFAEADWIAIARFVNALWQKDGSRWLVTTSYRTGSAVESLLKQHLDSAALLDAVWYGEAPRRVTRPFLGLASRVFVTVDSLTMVTEAVASGKPVYALGPAGWDPEPANTHLRYIQDLAGQGRITLVRPQDPPDLPPATPSAEIDYSGPVRQLVGRIHWKP